MGDQIVARYGLHDQMDPAIQHYEEKVISWYKEQRKNDKNEWYQPSWSWQDPRIRTVDVQRKCYKRLANRDARH